MFKQFATALFLFSMSVFSYAYHIESTLLVTNNTDIPLVFAVTQPDGQPYKLTIPAHSEDTIKKEVLNNNDYTGILYRAATQRFEIRSDDAIHQLYAQGRVVYYVHGSLWQEYSFLDSLSTAQGITIDAGFKCEADTNVFNNKIIINGKPEGTVLQPVLDYPRGIYCRGLKASTLDKSRGKYQAACTNGKNATFDKIEAHVQRDIAKLHYLNSDKTSVWTRWYHIYALLPETALFDNDAVKQSLDNALNAGSPGTSIFCGFDAYSTYYDCNEFCGSWSKENAL